MMFSRGCLLSFLKMALLLVILPRSSNASDSQGPSPSALVRNELNFPPIFGQIHAVSKVPRGGGIIPAGCHPLGYMIAPLGEKFLDFNGSLESDVGRFLASLKKRKSTSAIKEQWLEILRVSKSAQSMRIYRQLSELISFCLKAGFIN